ncbi:MAG: hypothetical protein JW727_01300 [Candidatus Aenigmarchaeota archaeon]|nr:hypothetical protein [Candidatus Aenigmarchaeota archaeon]
MGTLINQYEDYPSMPTPEASSQAQSGSKDYTKVIYVVIGLVVLVMIYFIFFSGGSDSPESHEGDGICQKEYGENCVTSEDCKCTGSKICSEAQKLCVDESTQTQEPVKNDTVVQTNATETKKAAVNGICEKSFGENCVNTPGDCTCSEGAYCSDVEKDCVISVCGNGKCELYEGPDNCCLDCECFMPGEVCDEESHACEYAEMALSDERAIELASQYIVDQGIDIEATEVEGVKSSYGKLIKLVKVTVVGDGVARHVGVAEDESVTEIVLIG